MTDFLDPNSVQVPFGNSFVGPVNEAFDLGVPRSPQWSAVRDAHLKEQPACVACGATDQLNVHHKLPFHLHPELELDDGNLITLCEKPGHSCHFVFGHFHDWSSYNPDVASMTADYLQHQEKKPAST